MKRLIPCIILAIALSSSCRDRYVAFSGYAQGGTYTVKANLKGVRVAPQTISSAIDSILKRIEITLSGYNAASDLSRLNGGDTIVVNDVFAGVYNISRRLYDETEGAFNVAAAPLFDIWGFGFTGGRFPSQEKIDAALKLCDMTDFPDSLVVGQALFLDGRKLNFNAIAQGYSSDLVASYLYGIGVKDMLVDIGEIFLDGFNPSGEPWSIGVDRPVDGNNTPGAQIDSIIRLGGAPRGIVTSGNYRKFYVKDGRKYAHTLDPRTGYPVDHQLLSATIIAPNAALADAYATYCMVIGPREARSFIDSREDLEGYLISADNTLD